MDYSLRSGEMPSHCLPRSQCWSQAADGEFGR